MILQLKETLTSGVNVLNIGGFFTSAIIQSLENTSQFFELLSPLLNAIVVITVVIYNLLNISKLRRKDNEEKPL
jgi:hypothetical protein